MFNSIKRKINLKHQELVSKEKQEFISVLKSIKNSLEESENKYQAKFVVRLIEQIQNDQLDIFIEKICGVDMWGGSGAVWEVGISSNKIKVKFEKEIVTLINVMDKTKIADSSIRRIRRLFRETMESDLI